MLFAIVKSPAKPSALKTLRNVAVAAAALVVATLEAASAAPATSLARSIDVDATPAQVWSLIGGFCTIKEWHPVIASCTLDGKAPPTRTLLAKDGKTKFVEREMARDDAGHLYSYNFVSTPLAAADYYATFRVVPHGTGSTILWSGSYIPQDGKEKEVLDAIAGIYEAGLAGIKAKLAK